MTAVLPPGKLQVRVIEATSLDALLAGPCPAPSNFPPGLLRRCRAAWAGLRSVRSTYRPGYVAFIVEIGQELRGQFVPVETVREFLKNDPPPTVSQVLDHAEPGALIVVLRARRAVVAFGALPLDPSTAEARP